MKDSSNKFFSEKTKRKIRFGTNAVVLTIAVIVVAIVVNLILEKLPMTLDFTAEKLFSITDTSKNLLEKLDKDGNKNVEITVLLDRTKAETGAYSSNYDTSAIVKVLDVYDRYDSINVQYIDPNKNPSVVTDVLGSVIKADDGSSTRVSTLVSDCSEGDTIVKCGDKVKIIKMADMFATSTYTEYYSITYVSGVQIETVVTAAVLHVTQEQAPAIYFSKGFGENSISKYSVLVFDLEFMGYSVSEIDLVKEGIPDDAVMLFFMGPKMDLSASVTDQLENWFSNHTGNGVFMMDVDETGTDLPNFNYIFNLFGLQINNDIVKEDDSKSIAGDDLFTFKSESLTQGAFANIPNTELVIDNTRSITVVSDNISRNKAYELVQTTKHAKSIDILSGKETEGTKTVAASGEYFGGTTEAKILVTGSSVNVKDKYDYGNKMSRILLQAVNWMYESDITNEATEIDTKLYNTTTVSVTDNQSKIIGVCCIIVYPLIILSIGLVIFLKRRHL